jgi:beta-glucosidase
MITSFHHAAADRCAAACLALQAGIEVELPTTRCYGDPLRAALESGDLSLELLDQAVGRHLQKKFELGLFDDPYVAEGRTLEVFDTAGQRSLARQVARQSMVLLKNEGMLPLKKTIETLAVIGPNADDRRNLLGDYSYASTLELMRLREPDSATFAGFDPAELAPHQVRVVSILEGIQALVSPQTNLLYARGCDNLSPDRSGFAEAVRAAQQADAVVLVLGDRSGMTPDCTTGEFRDSATVALPGVQAELAQAVIGAGKPVAVILINGRPLAIPWLSDHAGAILEAWIPGEEGGTAVAETLFGESNPGGKLAMTFPRSVGQLPVFYNCAPSGMRSHWYGDYVEEKVTPLYPFGHGLSYTTYEYHDLCLDKAHGRAGECVSISVRVTNTGNVAGDEVVQLYVCDEYASLPRPVKELKGYIRLRLEPGQSKTVTFDLPVDMLAFYDPDLNLVLEPGRIVVMVGSSSTDIRLTSAFEIVGKCPDYVDERIFVCPSAVN